jgi:4-hydroxybenzoate polyprenyltransferase
VSPSRDARGRAWGQLLRLSLAPSAAADVAAGILLAYRGRWPGGAWPWILIAASLCIYHGGLALNDWADREHDARTRPSRPIPSGAVAPNAAAILGIALLAAGPLLAWRVSAFAAAWALALALAALAYDVGPRGAWLGPSLLALCRAGNVGLGRIASLPEGARWSEPLVALAPCVLYGLYVLRVSRLGRLEDGEDAAPLGQRPSALLLGAAALLAIAPFLPPLDATRWQGRAVAIAIAWSGAAGLAAAARGTREWTRSLVERAMGLALRRLLLFGACFAAVSFEPPEPDALIACGVILCGYPLAFSLRRVFPPS